MENNSQTVDWRLIVNTFNENSKTVHISLGGDGTFLQAIADNPKKAIFPVRDYGNCASHPFEHILDEFINLNKSSKTLKTLPNMMKLYIMPRLQYHLLKSQDDPFDSIRQTSRPAAAEIVFKNADISEACRFDVIVNGHSYLENVICDGAIVSTPLGSHGYFKSVTRTMFYEGIGVAFVAPTYGICNLVLKPEDRIDFVFKRPFIANVSSDKDVKNIEFAQGDVLTVQDACDNASVIGYDMFMCPECRKGRNSTVINDQYFVGPTNNFTK